MGTEFFDSNVVTRLLWALGIIAGGLAAYWLINRSVLLHAQQNTSDQGLSVPGARPGVPAIVYFTTPECVPCKTVQRPALAQIQARLGEQLQVIEINAQERADLASRWGVLSVPTTFIIDEAGQVRHVNHGATRAEKLLQQLKG